MTNGKSVQDAIALDSDSEAEEVQVSSRSEHKTQNGSSKPVAQGSKTLVEPAPLTRKDSSECGKATRAAIAAPESAPVHPALAISKEERAALEAARQERNRKRRREQGLPSDDEGGSNGHASKKTLTAADRSDKGHGVENAMLASMSSTTAQPRTKLSASPYNTSYASSSTPSASPYKSISATDRFWHGAVKYSHNDLAPSNQIGVQFGELFLPATKANAAGLKQAILCVYGRDAEFVFGNTPVGKPRSLGGDAPDCLLITGPEGYTVSDDVRGANLISPFLMLKIYRLSHTRSQASRNPRSRCPTGMCLCRRCRNMRGRCTQSSCFSSLKRTSDLCSPRVFSLECDWTVYDNVRLEWTSL